MKTSLDQFQEEQSAMSDKDLVEKAKQIISKLAETGGRSHKMTVPPEITDTDMILSEIVKRFESALKSAKDNPDRSDEPVNYFEIQEYTFDDYMKLEKETLVKLLMNCQKLLYGNQYAISNNHVEFTSSNQPVQSVKGEGERTDYEDCITDIKSTIRLAYETDINEGWSEKFLNENIEGAYSDIMDCVKKMESYKHSESKEQYPDTEADGYVFCGKCGKMK